MSIVFKEQLGYRLDVKQRQNTSDFPDTQEQSQHR